ncbi:XkdF-like putative serine protease domain-containing protein [Natrinema sp. DC36]|uniref:XkdF-like putative serine protease domain-containing protein n=1 Tax=Natrinema sp. DC36 TaxID=2878680 RepID=UPI001CF01C64|nr:XkdF-like putative serine protease domain-containing protein [Natrinema sp. DC36]
MPPVTKAGGDQFRKDVEFVTKDDDEQVAAGIVMVPDKVDLQNDFAREETIRGFADQFEAFVDAGEAGGGIMHAVFPDGWMELERNEVLDEAEEIGGSTVDAGAWVQEWAINENSLWELIADGILEGYSIGAIQVGWDGPYEQDDDVVDDVAVPDDLGEDALVWELIDGLIREVSAVDIPAVPDAQILETKADAEKRLGDYLGDPNGFVEEALERGHSESDAQEMWDVLNEAAQVEGSTEPGEKGWITRAKAFFTRDEPGRTSDPTFGKDVDTDVGKEGRTLSTENRDSLFATIDAAADVLEDAGIDHGIQRFTDRGGWDFDLSEHTAREWSNDEDEDEDEDGSDGEGDGNWELAVEDGTEGYQHSESGEFVAAEEATVEIITDAHGLEWSDTNSTESNDAGGDTSDESGTEAAADTDTKSTETDMTDESTNDGEGGDKSLAKQNAEQINDLTQAVENLTESLTGPEAKTAEIEIDGETYEVREDAAKAALGVDEESDIGVADAIERLNEKAGRVDEVENRLDTIVQQTGAGGESQQLEAAADEGEENDDGGLGDLGKALS